MAKKETLHSFLTLILSVVLAFMVYLYFSGQLVPRAEVAVENASGGSDILKTESQFRDKLAELRMQREKVERGLKKLEMHKSETIDYLKEKGINSGKDFLDSEDNDVKYAAGTLKGWSAQIKKTKTEIKYYDDAISGIKAMLDRIERERINESVELSEEESISLQKIVVDLNERLKVDLDVVEEEELGKLLDLEMHGKDLSD